MSDHDDTCFGRIWTSAKTTVQAAAGMIRLSVFVSVVLPLAVVMFSFATIQEDFDGYIDDIDSSVDSALAEVVSVFTSSDNSTNSTSSTSNSTDSGGIDFPGVVSLTFGTFCRIFQVAAAVLLMGETIITTQSPFGLQVAIQHGFLNALRLPWGYVVSCLMLITATINSESYDTFLDETRLDKAIEKTSAALTGHIFKESCDDVDDGFPIFDVTADTDTSEYIDNPGEGTSGMLVLEIFTFSKAALLCLGAIGIVLAVIDRIRSPDKEIEHNELDNHAWRSRRWYDDNMDKLELDQSKRTRARRALLLLWPLFSIGLQCYFLSNRANQNGIDTLTNNGDNEEWFETLTDGAFYITHLAQLILAVLLAVNIIWCMTRSTVGIIHSATVLGAMFVLFLSVADFGPFMKSHLGDEFGDDSTATGVAAGAVVLLLLPLVAQIVLPNPKGGEGESCLDPVTRHMIPDALEFVKKICTPSIRWYRAGHSLAISAGVASLLLAFLSMGSPMVSLDYSIGPAFDTLKVGVEDIEAQITELKTKLGEAAANLDPCVSLPPPAEVNKGLEGFLKSAPFSTTKGLDEYEGEDYAIADGDVSAAIDACAKPYPGSMAADQQADCDALHSSLALTEKFNKTGQAAPAEVKDTCSSEFFPETKPDPESDRNQQCDDIMCGVFFGTMIALTAASCVPFAGAAAVGGKIAARIARTVISFGKRLFKVYKTVGKYKNKVLKALSVLKRVASAAGKTALYPANGFLWMFVPLFIAALFCIFVGFWKRKKLRNALYTGGVSLMFGTLSCINLGLFLASFAVVPAVTEILSNVPEALVVFTVNEETGMRFLQGSLACATFSCTYWALATASEATLRMLKLVFTCGRYGRKKHDDDNSGSGHRGGSSGSGHRDGSSDSVFHSKRSVGGWLVAILILVPGLIMTHTAYVKQQRAVVFGAWNNDDANNVMDALQSSGVLGKSTEILDDDTSSMGCGPVGLAVQAIGAAVFAGIKAALPNFNLAFVNMREAAESFVAAVASSITDINNPFKPIDLSIPWNRMEFVILFTVPLLACALIFIGCLVALFLPHYVRVLDFCRTQIFSIAITGLQFVLAIVGVAMMLDSIKVPFFELRVEWGQGATSAIVLCFLCIISSFSLNVNVLLPVGNDTEEELEENNEVTDEQAHNHGFGF
eukprot:m.239263 g.239263  ORF g.239263 m.239263 type:complete len:1168 (+) comp33741_c0_seq1:179-3682(+)